MPTPITLGTVAEGAAEDLWSAELDRVLANIEDPNADWKTKRTITLTFTFAVNEERQVGDLTISAKTKLAGLKGRSTVVFLGRDKGRLVAVEAAHQEDMFAEAPEYHVIVKKEEGA
jgi:hypothetical protein